VDDDWIRSKLLSKAGVVCAYRIGNHEPLVVKYDCTHRDQFYVTALGGYIVDNYGIIVMEIMDMTLEQMVLMSSLILSWRGL
jgi:hypothetical protein